MSRIDIQEVVNIVDKTGQRYRNRTILQGFEWWSPGTISISPDSTNDTEDDTISHWTHLANLLPQFAALGITSIWIPPACKATGPGDNGYGIYDLYDLGEFDTKWTIATKWGTKQELTDLCARAKALGIGIIFDAVFNHKAAADGSEEAYAVRVDPLFRDSELDSKPRLIESWTKFNFEAVNGRNGKYSSMKYNKDHFSGVDWDSRTKEKGIFKFVGTRPDGTRKDWAKDVGRSENGNYDFLMFADVDFGHPEVREDVKRWGRWLVDELPGVRGFRLDAIKHYSCAFQKEFIDYVTEYANSKGGDFFFVGEYWLANSKVLAGHIDKTFGGKMHMFDVKLLYNFHEMSQGRLRDLRKIFKDTLVELNPQRAVTFVTNHDTQETQSLEAPVDPWFIPHAYALILLRQEGLPCLFWGDVYGTNGPKPRSPACGGRLVRLAKARSLFAYGDQINHPPKIPSLRSKLGFQPRPDMEFVAWQRSWTSPSHGRISLVVLVSISWEWKKRRICVGKECVGQVYTDIMGWAWSGVLIDKEGNGDFPVGPRSISVWTWRDAPGRNEIDGLVYPAQYVSEEATNGVMEQSALL